jgi:hypothetical protein
MTTPAPTPTIMTESSLVETIELVLSTKSKNSIILNGEKKSKIQYNLRNMIDFENDKTIDFVTISMPYATLPNSSYNVNDYSNTLNVAWGGNNYSYVFTNGNYTYSSFITAFQGLLPSHFSITYNPTTNKFTITNTSYSFTLLTSSIDYIIGFTGTLASSGSAPFTLQMIRVVNFLPNPIINICCQEINNGQSLGINGNPLFSNILASIPNTSKLNNELVYQNATDEFVIKNVSNNTLNISILDDDANFMDFNGISSWFLLRFRVHKRIKSAQGNFSDFITKATNIRNLIEPSE